MGYARRRFEGDTLVVETTNFDPRMAYQNSNPDTLKVVGDPIAAADRRWIIDTLGPLVGIIQVQGRRYDLVADCENAKDRLDSSSAAHAGATGARRRCIRRRAQARQ